MSVESYLATQQRMIVRAKRDVDRLVREVDMNDPDAARDFLMAQMPSLIIVWGEIVATAAAEYSESLIGEPAVLAEAVDPEVVESMVGWAVGPLYGVKNDDGSVTPPDPAKARRNLQGGVQRHVMNTGRNTIRYNSEARDGIAWARILQGETNCAFCVVMASRGGIYDTAETAGAKSESEDPRIKLGDDYHDHCDCQVIPIRDERDYPEGYDPDVFYEQYMAARRNASDHPELGYKTLKGGDNNILTQMRAMYGMK